MRCSMANIRGPANRLLLNGVCVLLSAHFAIAYNTLTTPMVSFEPAKELNGRGGVFAYRMLPAILWKACVFLLHPVHARFPGLHLPALNKPFDSNEAWFMVLLTFCAMLGTLLVARRLLSAIVGADGQHGRWGFEWMALGMGYAAYFDSALVLKRNLFYPYDVLALFFFMLLVYLAFMGRPLAFTAILVPAMLNKETAIVSVLVYFGLRYRPGQRKRLVALCGCMAAAAIAVRLLQTAYIHRICPACIGMPQNQLSLNLHQLTNPLFWLSEASVFGFAYVATILFWRYVPGQVRLTVLAVCGLWIAMMAMTGVLREVRIFSELSALVLLVVGLGVHGWLEERRNLRLVA